MAARVGATPVVKYISGSGDKEEVQTREDMLGAKTQASLQATWPLGEMTQVAGRQGASLEEMLWWEMVQMILFTDATCGTSTPFKALDLLHFYTLYLF